LFAQDFVGGASCSGDRDIAVGGPALRGEHPEQRAFAVSDDGDGRETSVGTKAVNPSRGVVGVDVEPEVRFADHRRRARRNPSLVVPQRRDAALGQPFGE
jgi:hypothetical protein